MYSIESRTKKNCFGANRVITTSYLLHVSNPARNKNVTIQFKKGQRGKKFQKFYFFMVAILSYR